MGEVVVAWRQQPETPTSLPVGGNLRVLEVIRDGEAVLFLDICKLRALGPRYAVIGQHHSAGAWHHFHSPHPVKSLKLALDRAREVAEEIDRQLRESGEEVVFLGRRSS